MVQAVYLSLLFLEGWTHWSPLPVGIHHIPSCSLAARFPSGWWGRQEGVGAVGGGWVANRLLYAQLQKVFLPPGTNFFEAKFF